MVGIFRATPTSLTLCLSLSLSLLRARSLARSVPISCLRPLKEVVDLSSEREKRGARLWAYGLRATLAVGRV